MKSLMSNKLSPGSTDSCWIDAGSTDRESRRQRSDRGPTEVRQVRQSSCLISTGTMRVICQALSSCQPTDRSTYRPTDRQTDLQTDRLTDSNRKPDRMTESYSKVYIFGSSCQVHGWIVVGGDGVGAGSKAALRDRSYYYTDLFHVP